MKDCCQPDAPKGKFRKAIDFITTSIILLLLGAGLLLMISRLFRG